MQVAFLVKVRDEYNPPNDCPSISVAMFKKTGQEVIKALEYTEVGKGSNCVKRGMAQYCLAVPWKCFFHGSHHLLPQALQSSDFILDLYAVRESVQDVYRVGAHSRLGIAACALCH